MRTCEISFDLILKKKGNLNWKIENLISQFPYHSLFNIIHKNCEKYILVFFTNFKYIFVLYISN